jgi:general secretion pathway protein D
MKIKKLMHAKIFFLWFFSSTFCITLFGYAKKRKPVEQEKTIEADSSITTTQNSLSSNYHENYEDKQKPIKPPIRPESATDDKDDLIEVNLENTDLPNLLQWVSDVFEINFLSDDALKPPPQGGKTLTGNKISFKTHAPITKKEVWDLFVTFLDLFGFGLVQGTIPNFYRVMQNDPKVAASITKAPLPSYINIRWEKLPNNDTTIRYVYFVQNSSLATIQSIVDAFRSQNSTLKSLPDLNAFLLTDKAANIRAVMQVVEELDRLTQPEALSVLKLKNADADEVVKLYNNLTQVQDPRGLAARILGTAKKPTSVYFPETLRLIAERRTNTLIILGDAEGIKKVEDFIINYVDTELKLPYSPLYVYDLQYTNAKDMADILTAVTKPPSTPASQFGGVREGDKYLQPIIFQAEEQGNRLLIKAEKEDYLKVREIIKQLDVKQPQVAIEVLIVNVIATDDRELGVQIRNKDSNTVSKNLDFQTSGFPLTGGSKAPPQVQPDSTNNPSAGSLMANLISLAVGQTPGSTLLSIANTKDGVNASGVWAIFKLLQAYARTNVISNPFLITTNKYPAEVSIGETRRVQTSVTAGTQNTFGFGDVSANLAVKITPQINSIGMINLAIDISIDNFTEAADPNDATIDSKTVHTNANVGNGEVLAIGGLLQTTEADMTAKVPILGDMPLIGWFFKSKTKTKRKDNLIVFISPRIIEPRLEGGMNEHTKVKSCKAKDSFGEMRTPAEKRDPIHRWFFKDYPCENTEFIDDFIAHRNNEPYCRVACEECPEQIDPDYVCCQETKRFITSDDKSPAKKEHPIIVEKNTDPKQNSIKLAAHKKSTKKSITQFLPPKNNEGVA